MCTILRIYLYSLYSDDKLVAVYIHDTIVAVKRYVVPRTCSLSVIESILDVLIVLKKKLHLIWQRGSVDGGGDVMVHRNFPFTHLYYIAKITPMMLRQ